MEEEKVDGTSVLNKQSIYTKKSVCTAGRTVLPKLSGSTAVRKSVFIVCTTDRISVAQDLLGISGRRPVAHTRPAAIKMPRASSAFPQKEVPQAPDDKHCPSKKG